MRPHRLSGPRRITATTVVALSLLIAGAFAYWSNTGQANASAILATLAAPAISSATPGAQTVELTWSAVTPPASGTVEYFVTRDGGAPSSGCPSSSSHSTATSCTDTGVSIGAHEYTVTAVWRTWTATSAAKSVAVAFGPATHLQLEAASATPTAGEADSLTITAKDAGNNTVGTYSGSCSLVFEGASEATSGEEPIVVDRSGVERSFGEATEITFTEGRATVSSATNGVMKLYKAEAAHIKVREGSLNNSTGLAVTVKAAAAKKLKVPTPSIQEAGVAFSVTLTATDEYGNTATSYAGAKTLAFSEPASSPSAKAPSYPATVTFTAGAGSASIKLYDAQTTTLKAKEGTTLEGTSGSFIVRAATAKKFTVPTPSEQEAGVAFNLTLTAIDEYGNTATSYAGAKTLAFSGPANAPSGTTPEYPTSATAVTFAAGVGTASAIKLDDAQSTTLKAKEGVIEGASGSFTVKAAGATSFSLPTPTEREAGVAFSETVTAWDTWHNTAKSYAGAKTLVFSEPSSSPSGQAPSYPATVTFTAGAGSASIKLYDAQSTTLKAKEGVIEGATGAFMVKAAATKKFILPALSEQEAGVAFNVALTATDEWGNLTAGYAGAKTIAFSEPASSPSGQAPEYPTSATAVTFAAGVGTASAIKLSDAQGTTLKAKEGATVVGTSSSFTVKAATAERLAWAHAEVSAGKLEAGTCPFACTTTSIGSSKKFKAHASITDAYGNIVSNIGATAKAKVEKTSGEGTLTNATGLSIPASGLAESSTIFEYASPASGTSEAVLKLRAEEAGAYTEAEAHVKY
jgi:S-adenosylmethionine hydrolase